MMIEPADIRRLLDAFENSDWDEIRLSMDGTEVLISASDTPASRPVAAPSQHAAAMAPSPRPAETPPPGETGPEGPGGATLAPSGTASQEIPEGAAVCSPSPGIFWRSPAPGAPPFIEVGQQVAPDSVVCIVEVMKLMNRVMAGVSGTVAAILVENSVQVGRGQPLVIVTPDGADGA